jgi:hypothetical protein
MSRIHGFFLKWRLGYQPWRPHPTCSFFIPLRPLPIASCVLPRAKKPSTFRFEEFWVHMPGFSEVAKKAWVEPSLHTDPYHILQNKFQLTGKHRKQWSKSLLSHAKIQLHVALLVILHLDLSMEQRFLTPEESHIRARIKRRVIVLAVLYRFRKKQRARINNLRDGDANTKIFHKRVNSRRRKTSS